MKSEVFDPSAVEDIQNLLLENVCSKYEIADILCLHWREVQAILKHYRSVWPIITLPNLMRSIPRFESGEVWRIWSTRPNLYPERLLAMLRTKQSVCAKEIGWTVVRINNAAQILIDYGAKIGFEPSSEPNRTKLRLEADLGLRLWPTGAKYPKVKFHSQGEKLTAASNEVLQAVSRGCETIDEIRAFLAVETAKHKGFDSLDKLAPYLSGMGEKLLATGWTIEDMDELPEFVGVFAQPVSKIRRDLVQLVSLGLIEKTSPDPHAKHSDEDQGEDQSEGVSLISDQRFTLSESKPQ